MKKIIGIRREDKNQWERRVPIVPEDVKFLLDEFNIKTEIQPSKIRAFQDKEYEKVGALVKEKLDADVIFGIKEMPVDFFEENKTYVFFSHTIKGQSYNMPMLKRMMEKKNTLIDYERIVDENNRRLIYFGNYAGYAGMMETLVAFFKKIEKQGIKTTISQEIKQPYMYTDLQEMLNELVRLRGLFEKQLIHGIIGITGYGNVSKGAQEVLKKFKVHEIEIKDLNVYKDKKDLFYVVFKEEDMVERIDRGEFELSHYYEHPHKYHSIFSRYLPYLDVLVNAIYWDQRYPRLIERGYLRGYYDAKGQLPLKVIGDISCDIRGAVEITEWATEPDEPSYTYYPDTDIFKKGIQERGITITAIDNLPAELPKDSSRFFSSILKDFVRYIVETEEVDSFLDYGLPEYLKAGVILYKGKLTPQYKYLIHFL